MTRRQTLLWRHAVRRVTYLYAEAWLRNRGMAHAKFKVAVHLRQLEARLGLRGYQPTVAELRLGRRYPWRRPSV